MSQQFQNGQKAASLLSSNSKELARPQRKSTGLQHTTIHNTNNLEESFPGTLNAVTNAGNNNNKSLNLNNFHHQPYDDNNNNNNHMKYPIELALNENNIQSSNSQNIKGSIDNIEHNDIQASPLLHQRLKGFFLKLKMKNWTKKIVNKTRSRMYKTITVEQLKMIDDKSYDASQHILRKRSSLISKFFLLQDVLRFSTDKGLFYFCLDKIDSILPALPPKHFLKSFADSIGIISVIIIFFSLSVVVSFQTTISEVIPNYIIHFCLLAIIFNIIVRLNTAQAKLGSVVSSRRLLLKGYLKNNFIYDFFSLSAVIILLFLDNSNLQNQINSDLFATIKVIVLLPFFLKVKDISKRIQNFEDKIFFKQRTQHIIQLLRLLSLIIFINHILACIWIFNSKLSSNQNINWMDSLKNFNSGYEQGWLYEYTLSFYFCTVTMTTVGYGDITAKNISEYYIAICMMLTSSGVFGFTLNQIGNIFAEFSSEEKELKKKLNIINLHMEKKDVGHALRSEVREYLEYVWRENNEKFANDSALIVDQLNEELKRQLYLHQNKRIIAYLSNFFSEGFIQKAILVIQECQIKPSQNIQTKGNCDENCLYLVEKGKVEIFIDRYNQAANTFSSKTIKVLEEGSMFGISEFYTGQSRNLNMKAQGFVKLLKISRKDFLKILEDFPLDAEAFHYLKDKQLLQGECGKVGEQCYSCGNKDHVISTCPYLHIVCDKSNMVTKLNYKGYETQITRRQWNRNYKGKKEAIFEKEHHNEADWYEQFMSDYMELLDEYELKNLNFDFNYSYIDTGIQQEDDQEDEEYEHDRIKEEDEDQIADSVYVKYSDNRKTNSINCNNSMLQMMNKDNNISPQKYPQSNNNNNNNLSPTLIPSRQNITDNAPSPQQDNNNSDKKKDSIILDSSVVVENHVTNISSTNSNITPHHFLQLTPMDGSPVHCQIPQIVRQISANKITNSNNTPRNQQTKNIFDFGEAAISGEIKKPRKEGKKITRAGSFLMHQSGQLSLQRKPSIDRRLPAIDHATDRLLKQASRQSYDRFVSQNSLKKSPQNNNNNMNQSEGSINNKRQEQNQFENFQKTILQNLKAIMGRTYYSGQTLVKTQELTEEQANKQAMQLIFQTFDKCKNFSVYFPLSNLNFILQTRQNKKFMSPEQYLLSIQATGKNHEFFHNNLQNNLNSIHNFNIYSSSQIYKSKNDISMNNNNNNYPSGKKSLTLKNIFGNMPLNRRGSQTTENASHTLPLTLKQQLKSTPQSIHQQCSDNLSPRDKGEKLFLHSSFSSQRQISKPFNNPTTARANNSEMIVKSDSILSDSILPSGVLSSMNSPNVKEDTDYFNPHYKEQLQMFGQSKKRDQYFVKQQ